MLAIVLNLLVVLVCVAGLVAPFVGAKMLRQRARILRTPVRPVSTLDAGWTAVQGRAVPAVAMTGPFSGRPCAYYEARVEVLVGRPGKRSLAFWQTHAESTTHVPFYVEDETGRVLVSTLDDDAHLDVPRSFVLQTASENSGAITKQTPPHIFESLEAMGIPYLDENGCLLPLRYVEHHLEAGGPVYAIGHHSREPDDVARATEAAPLEATGPETGTGTGTGTIGSVITRADAKARAYVAPGDSRQVPRRLLKNALLCIFGGPLVTAAAGGFLYMVYFVW